jgi:hypothetical protein
VWPEGVTVALKTFPGTNFIRKISNAMYEKINFHAYGSNGVGIISAKITAAPFSLNALIKLVKDPS